MSAAELDLGIAPAVLELVIDVRGVPISQGSKSARVQGKRAVIYDDNAKVLKPWREAVTAAATARVNLTGWATLDGPIAVRLDFWLPRPPSVKRRVWPHVKPDVDKLARACLDSLTVARVWTDDACVVDLRAVKHYAQEIFGARITVTAIR